MRGLTIEQVLFLHARLIEETGGAHGVRDLSLPKSAVARPWATFGGRDLYPDLFSKAAARMDSLIHNHPFVDGNKRTGIAAAALFLRQNGHRLTATNEELEGFTRWVAESRPGIVEIAAWARPYAQEATHCKISSARRRRAAGSRMRIPVTSGRIPIAATAGASAASVRSSTKPSRKA
jgi:death-on-curing protein